MLYGEGVVGLVFLALWVWAIFDVIASDSSICRNLPKPLWLILVLFLPDIGSIAWLLLGRPQYSSFVPGGQAVARRETVGQEDDARRRRYAELDDELDRRIEARRLQEWEDDLRRREQQLGGSSDAPS
jgi:hypothetical protein